MRKRLMLPALALALALGAAGCATTQATVNQFNATAYVQGVLDETYKGAVSDTYLTLMDTDEESVAATYQANLQSEYKNRFLKRFEIDDASLTRQQRQDFLDLIDEAYSHADYTVKAAVALDDRRYCVEVSVTPVTYFSSAYSDGFATLVRNFERDNPEPTEEELSEMTNAKKRRLQRDRERDWAQAVYDFLYPRLSAVTTGVPVTKLVLVSPNGQGFYSASTTDLQDLDDRILAY